MWQHFNITHACTQRHPLPWKPPEVFTRSRWCFFVTMLCMWEPPPAYTVLQCRITVWRPVDVISPCVQVRFHVSSSVPHGAASPFVKICVTCSSHCPSFNFTRAESHKKIKFTRIVTAAFARHSPMCSTFGLCVAPITTLDDGVCASMLCFIRSQLTLTSDFMRNQRCIVLDEFCRDRSHPADWRGRASGSLLASCYTAAQPRVTSPCPRSIRSRDPWLKCSRAWKSTCAHEYSRGALFGEPAIRLY